MELRDSQSITQLCQTALRIIFGNLLIAALLATSPVSAETIANPNSAGTPVQYPRAAAKQTKETSISPDLAAILQAIFGMGSGFGGNSATTGCFGYSDLGCSSYQQDESYTPDLFQNAVPTSPSDLNTPYKILVPFRKYYDGCVTKAGLGTCRFVNLGIKGDKSHQARRSCHNSAQAIDVGPLTCSNGRRIVAGDPEFYEVAKCMANETNDELQVIFYKKEGPNMMQKSDHNNHMHIQLKNCAMITG